MGQFTASQGSSLHKMATPEFTDNCKLRRVWDIKPVAVRYRRCRKRQGRKRFRVGREAEYRGRAWGCFAWRFGDVSKGLARQGRASQAMHRRNKMRAHLFLGQKRIGATAIGNLLVGVARYRGHKYDDDFRPSLPNCGSSLQTVHERHGNIHENQVGLQVCGQTDGLKAVAGLSDHANLQIAFEQISNGRPELVIIVDNQHSDHQFFEP